MGGEAPNSALSHLRPNSDTTFAEDVSGQITREAPPVRPSEGTLRRKAKRGAGPHGQTFIVPDFALGLVVLQYQHFFTKYNIAVLLNQGEHINIGEVLGMGEMIGNKFSAVPPKTNKMMRNMNWR